MRRLIALLTEVAVPVGGFTIRELRHRGGRVGFAVEAVDGQEAVIAHVGWGSGPRVGRYRVLVAWAG